MNEKPTTRAPSRPPLRYLSPWHRATRQIQDHLAAEAAAEGVPTGVAHLLSYLGSYAPVPLGALVQVFGLRKSTLTGLVDRLEQAGLAARAVNPDDRRSFLVDLTPAGQDAAARLRVRLEAFEAALDAQLSPDQRQAFTRMLDAIKRVTSPQPPTPNPGE